MGTPFPWVSSDSALKTRDPGIAFPGLPAEYDGTTPHAPDFLMTSTTIPRHALAAQIVDRIDLLLRDAHLKTRPLELEPYRGQLFELFVTAEGGGYLQNGADPDLTADGLCKILAERWGLAEATRMSHERQMNLPKQHVNQMRLLWSLMRMWMEWTYAWQRWEEFHGGAE